ncbi:MAG: acetate--CoA ligase family protein [Haloarcula sp.]
MTGVFTPASIAVIGASADLNRISGLPVKYLQKHGYEGEIYPVNPNHDEVGGLQSYPRVSDLPETPDLAMVILPARLVLDVVSECLETGVETVLIVSSGFSETGDEVGSAAERELRDMAERYDARVIGPNSQGLINVKEHVTASFTPALKRESLIPGDVSFVTQSGAFGGALTTMIQDDEIGLNRWVATGNEAHLESLDVLRMLAEDDSTEVVAGYIEGFVDGRKLLELKRTDVGIELPIVFLKVGRSDRGKAAAGSHTGKVAGSQRVYDGVFRETGVMAVDDVYEFIDVTRTVSILDRLPGPRLGVITTSGGAGVHIADVAAEEGLDLPELAGETRERIEEFIPDYGSAVNPVDITAQVVNSPEAFKECLRLLLADDALDAVVLQITNATGDQAERYAEFVTSAAANSETPLFVVWTGGINKKAGKSVYREADVPVFENPAAAIRTIGTLNRFKRSKERLYDAIDLPARPPAPENKGPEIITETRGKQLLADYGVPIPDERLVTSASEAVAAADNIGYPVVAKLVSPEVNHRDRIGGISTGIASASEVKEAFERIRAVGADRAVTVEGVSIQQQVNSGIELSLGIVVDDDFGPMVMFGRGGVDIESVDDVAFRTIPTARAQADGLLEDLKTFEASTLSEDQREALVDTIIGLSDLYLDNPWIREADINPILVGPDEVVAVDSLFLGPGQ